MKLGQQALAQFSLNDACARFYTEVAAHTRYGQRDQRYQMKMLIQAIGRTVLLSQLDDERINLAVQWMRTRPAKNDRPAGLSGATINRYLTTLNVICQHARTKWRAEVGPWRKAAHHQAEPQGREVFLDHAQARALVAAAPGHLRPILLLDLMTGLRRDNVVQLQWESVSLDLGRIVMRQKGDRRLSVTLPPAAVAMLAAIEPEAARRRGAVFRFGNPNMPCDCPRCANPRYARQAILNVKRSFATAVETAGLDKLPQGRMRFHDVRHTFASLFLEETGDLRLLQDQMQHRHITTTARYAHLLPGRKESAVANVAAKLLASPIAELPDTKRAHKPKEKRVS